MRIMLFWQLHPRPNPVVQLPLPLPTAIAGSDLCNLWLQWFNIVYTAAAWVASQGPMQTRARTPDAPNAPDNSGQRHHTHKEGNGTCMEASSGKFALLKRGIGFQPRASSTSPWWQNKEWKIKFAFDFKFLHCFRTTPPVLSMGLFWIFLK